MAKLIALSHVVLSIYKYIYIYKSYIYFASQQNETFFKSKINLWKHRRLKLILKAVARYKL